MSVFSCVMVGDFPSMKQQLRVLLYVLIYTEKKLVSDTEF